MPLLPAPCSSSGSSSTPPSSTSYAHSSLWQLPHGPAAAIRARGVHCSAVVSPVPAAAAAAEDVVVIRPVETMSEYRAAAWLRAEAYYEVPLG